MAEDQGAVAVVKKKRRVLWIVGGVLGFVALLFVTAFLIEWNSPDARMERAVAQIVDDYGFVARDYPWYDFSSLVRDSSIELYSRESTDAETEDEIVARLRAACPSWEYSSRADLKYFTIVRFLFGPIGQDYSFISPERNRGSVVGVYFAPVAGGQSREHQAFLGLIKQDKPSLWERIKGMWPW